MLLRKRRKKKNNITTILCAIIFVCGIAYFAYSEWFQSNSEINADYGSVDTVEQENVSDSKIPEYKGKPYCYINDNKVDYKPKKTKPYIKLKELDSLGRCQTAESIIGPETLPTEERKSIGMVKPSGWPKRISEAKFDFIDGKYAVNRTHLLGFCLTGLNADPRNLITGTRSLNATYMWDYEEKVLNYIKNTDNHVFYRVTPVFKNKELVARGVEMEAKSIENDEIEFNVFIYNVQDGLTIDYLNGEIKENN